MGWLLDWATNHVEWIVGGVCAGIAAFVFPIIHKKMEEGRSRASDQKKAATEFAHTAREYRRLWIREHYDDLNGQPKPDNEEFQWSGSAFAPLLANAGLHAIHARLPDAIKAEAFALDEKVKAAKESIGQIVEYGHENLDTAGPIAVAEIAIAADQLFQNVARAADLPTSEDYDVIPDIKSWLVLAYKEQEEERQQRRKFTERMVADFETKKSSSTPASDKAG